MKIHRVGVAKVQCCEQFKDGSWDNTTSNIINDCLVLSDLSDAEHDAILNIADGLDNYGLRGYTVRLIVGNRQQDDIDVLNLVALPSVGHIIGDDDRYYRVDKILQKPMEVVALVQRLSVDELACFFVDQVAAI